ncbi:tape measure protein [Leuconostoc citreum]|uniref:tape measure protein n=1 Tax=Leuconostoc citreum TaxID=33964 RepID=UPI00200ACDF7|nr:tape measure protein [Leuconostoc citreum]MCK8605134.1 tape measure protein [Leuconostoc citreum]
MADGSINIDLLLNDQTDKTWTDFKQKAEQTGKDGYQKFKDAFKGDPLVAKLEAQANKAGINNFREMLNKLPKEKQTELLAKAEKGEVVNFEKLLREIPSKITSTVELNDNASTGLRALKNQAHDVGDKFHRLKDIMIGTFAAQALIGGIHAITHGIKEMTEAGMEYNKEQDTMKTVWHALTEEAPKDGEQLLSYINNLSQHSIYAAENINEMAQSFYHVHSNVDETKRWTDAFVALGSTLHMTGPQISESGEMFAKIVAGGKASAEDMAVMINRFPMFGEAMQHATGKTMKELYAMSAAGKLSADQFTQALDYLGEKYKGGTAEAMTSMQGMSMYLHSRLQVLSGEVMKSSFDMSKSATTALQHITSDDSMKKFADSIGKAFGSLLNIVGGFIQFVDKNKNTIIGVFSGIQEFIVQSFGIIGHILSSFATTFKIAVLGTVSDGKVGKKIGELKNSFEELAEAIKPIADAIGVLAGTIISGAFSTIYKVVQGVVDGFTSVGKSSDNLKKKLDFSGISDTIMNLDISVANFLKSVIEISKPLGQIIGAISSGVFETFGDVINLIVDGFKSMVGDVQNASNNINPLAKALQEVAKHKNALKAIGLIIGSIAVAMIAVKSVVGVFKMISSGIATVRIAVMLLGDTWKILNTIMKANVFILIITAVIAVGVALYELYKHNEKFRNFVNGLVKGAADFFKGIGKWFGEAWKTVSGFFKKVINFVKSDWKEILLFIVNPFAGAFALLYKHNSKFRKSVNNLVKAVIGYFKGIGKSIGSGANAIGKWFDGLVKGFVNGWNSFIKGVVKLAKGFGKLLLYALAIPVGLAMMIFGPLVKPIKNIFGSIIKWIKSAWKGVVKFLIDIWKPVQKSWNAYVNILVKISKAFVKLIMNVITSALKSIYKVWTTIWNAIKLVFTAIWQAISKFIEAELNFYKKIFTIVLDFIVKTWNNSWKAIGKLFESIWNGLKSFFTPIIKWFSDVIDDGLSFIKKIWKKVWTSVSDFFSDTWDNMKKNGSKAINSLKDIFDGILKKIGKSFGDAWDGIKNGFSSMWDGMKKLAGDGINAVIKIPNDGIEGINHLIHDFGGPDNALKKIKPVKFASGTGVFSNARRAITSPTMAILNDGTDSPATGNKEALIHPNGAMEVVQGTNTERLLMPGTEVLNASELAMIMGHEHFATGTGWLGSIWDGMKGAGSWVGKTAGNVWNGMKDGVDKFTKMLGFITDAVAHPVETMKKTFNPEAKGMGNMFNGLGSGLFGKVKNQAKDWWSSLWSMANDSSNDGASAGNKGDDYPWKSAGKDSGADPWGYFYRECVSFVASRLKNMGVAPGLFSGLGNGADWVNAPVGHSNNPKPGSVAVYGPGSEFGNHVAMVTGVQGGSFSGEEYNWNGDGNYHTYQGRSKKGATTFLDFGVGSLSGENKTSDDKGGPLQALIKGQVGGMFDWIKKFISPLTGGDSAGGGDVQSWSGDVKKALGVLGLSTSGSMVQKILKQIQTESGGNAKAIGGNDGLADGNATGLMQVKPGTFNAYKQPGHDNIMNGYDNILAGLAYAKDRYGSDLSFLGQGHGYENGGWANKPSIFGEINGQPEIAINPARSTADQHISEAIIARANKAPNSLSAKLAQVVKGAKRGMQSIVAQQPAIAGHGSQLNSNSGIDLSGDVHMVITMDSGEVARATYPKIQVLQNQEIQMKGQRTGNTYAY